MTLLNTMALAAVMSAGQGEFTDPGLMRQPDVNGDTIVFAYSGDIWVGSTTPGAIARRLTTYGGVEGRPHISPDGKWVAFIGMYDGPQNIYVMSIEGGEPKRLTFGSLPEQCFGWTADGKVAYGTPEGTPYGGRQAQLRLVDPKGGIHTETPIKEIANASFFADGARVAYNRTNSFNFNWRRYRGGTQGRVSIYNMKTNAYSEIPTGREQNYFPLVIGDDIFFAGDKNGTLNLAKYSGGKVTYITSNTVEDVRWPNTDGKRIIFERGGKLFLFDPATNKETKLSPKIVTENLAARPQSKSLVPYVFSGTISPSGNRVVLDARGELFSVPAKTGETRNLTKTSGVREMQPSWSPNGLTLAYISDRSGEREIYTTPQMGGESTQVTNNLGFRIESFTWTPDSKQMVIMAPNKAYLYNPESKSLKLITEFKYGGGGLDVSSDSKWIAYSASGDANGFNSIYLYEVATGKTTRVTDGFYNDGGSGGICFDKNGKYLFFTSDRTFSPQFGAFEFSLKVENVTRMYAMALNANVPNPYLEKNDEEPAGVTNEAKTEDDGMKIDLNGLANRIMVLPFPAGNYGGFTGTKNGFFAVADGVLTQYTMGSKAGTPIYEGVGSYEMTPDRQKMLVMGRGGPQIVPVAPGGNPNTGRLDLSGVEAVIDPKAEWKQMFWDAWRYERDYFYDDSMGKQDWLALGKRYEKYLGDVNSRFDLNYLLGMLIGELGTGHSYIQGQGDLGIIMPRNPVGNLCADYVVENGKVKFAKILRGSNDSEQYQTPLGLPGIDVKEGEFLLEIDGNEVNASTHPATLLQGKIGKTVSLLVGPSASGSGARKVRVKPISSDLNARYWEFIDGNRKKVLELSGGRIGYFHVRDTAAQGSEDVVRGFYSQWHKDAILVDERWNGGGYIQPWFVDTLSRTRKAMIQPRYGGDQPESPSNQGPMALLINQYAGSGGDFFPYMFRQAKRGPLIGKRTWGGLVGISGGYNLVDGGNLTAPGFSIYDPEKNEIIAENMGIDPDIDVDMRPDLVAQGKDPQLEAGVKYLLEQLAKMPPKKERVGTPKVGSNGKINP